MTLPREHLLDELATAFVQVVAAVAGATVAKGRDYGIDGSLRHIAQTPSGSFVEIDAAADFQVKATVLGRRDLEAIDYDLRVRNYNAIVTRRTDRTPFYLFLVCFPDEDEWLELAPDRLILRAAGYWWTQSGAASANRQTVRIRVPTRNGLTPRAIEDILRRSADRVAT